MELIERSVRVLLSMYAFILLYFLSLDPFFVVINHRLSIKKHILLLCCHLLVTYYYYNQNNDISFLCHKSSLFICPSKSLALVFLICSTSYIFSRLLQSFSFYVFFFHIYIGMLLTYIFLFCNCQSWFRHII